MRPLLVLLLALLCTTSPSSSGAAVHVDCNASGPVQNGKSWSTAFRTISQALASLGNGGEIWVKAGTYPERLALNTYTTIYGGFLGFEAATTQRLLGAFPTVIAGGRAGSVVTMPNVCRVTLDGLTIRDGLADRGGGIRCATNSTVNIRNCRIESCEANDFGGGVYYDTYTQGVMSDCVIVNNRAPNGAGAVVGYHSYPTLQNVLIVRNHASVSGGGLYCPFHSGALLVNCTIAFNTAALNGGGIYAYYGGPETFRRCIIACNTAPAGAGLYADGGTSSAVLDSCVWHGNTIGNLGGYLTVLPTGNLTCDPLFLMPERNEFHLRLDSPAPLTGAYPVSSPYAIARIGVAKLLENGSLVKLTNKVVSAVDGDLAYIQEPDRAAAIAVRGVPVCSPGQILTSVTGVISSDEGCPVLTASGWTICTGATCNPRPVAVPVRFLRDATAILTLTWGRVTSITGDGFILADGSSTLVVRSATAGISVGEHVTPIGVYTVSGSFLATSPPMPR